MTTIAFPDPSDSSFQFQATLDGAAYSCNVWWNVAGQRWYLTITDSAGNVIVTRAFISSASDYPINLAYPYFTTSTLVYYAETQTIVISP